jgi:hypothetical protein
MFGKFASITVLVVTVCLGLFIAGRIFGPSASPDQDILNDNVRPSLASMARQLQSTPSVPFTIGATEFNNFYDTTTDHFGDCGSGPVDSKIFSSCSESCAVGWTTSGEWLWYDFEAPITGNVDITLAVSSLGINKFVAIDVDGVQVGQISATGEGWDTFKARSIQNVPLAAGGHQLKLRFVSGMTNLCSISVNYSGAAPPAPAPTSAPPTANPTTRIKMYHEKGYFWQCDNVCDDSDPSKDFDPRWCLQCDGTTCQDNEFAKVRTCDASPSQTQNTMFMLVPTSSSGEEVRIQAANSNMCLTVTNYKDRTNKRNTRMKPCGTSNSQIWWTGGFGNFLSSSKFEIHPRGDPNYCLTTPHHPKDGEDSRVEKCAFARKDVSNWWIKFSP